MKQNLPTVSIIVCAYTEERWDDLLTAVDALQMQSVLPYEIIVVIDHNPALLARARAALSAVILIENTEPRGLSGARNSGLAIARGDVVAFIDEDAIAAPNWLEKLLGAYADPRVVGVGGAIEPRWHTGRPAWFPAEFDWVVGCTYRGMPETATTVRNLIGCNMSLRREAFAAIGGFVTGIGRIGTLPVGCEETELCIRVQQHWPDRLFIYEPQALVYHQVPGKRAGWRYFASRCYAEGRSKAQVVQRSGQRDGLATERAYTLKVLPLGVLRGLNDLIGGNLSGLARSGAIIAGLAITTVGYLSGRIAQLRHVPAKVAHA